MSYSTEQRRDLKNIVKGVTRDLSRDLINTEFDSTNCNYDPNTGECTGCDGYGRCYTINGIRLTTQLANINLLKLLNEMTEGKKHPDELTAYLQKRVLFKIIKDNVGTDGGNVRWTSRWGEIYGSDVGIGTIIKPTWHSDYYGDEFDGWKFTDLVKNEYNDFIDENGLTLESVLEYEYPHTGRRRVTFKEIKDIDRSLIDIPNRSHYDASLRENAYPDYEGIVGVVEQHGNRYRLRDGYHRLASAEEDGKDIVRVIVADFGGVISDDNAADETDPIITGIRGIMLRNPPVVDRDAPASASAVANLGPRLPLAESSSEVNLGPRLPLSQSLSTTDIDEHPFIRELRNNESNKCVACLLKFKTHGYTCGHVCSCEECAIHPNMNVCPICKTGRNPTKIYFGGNKR